MSFLKAEWRKLAVCNYEIEPKILAKYVPPNTELDLWDGKCFVSVVGFMFLNTRLMGLSIPLHRNFEEVNLRFYVKHKSDDIWKRGVVFIKELVPKAALTFVANKVYGEHYQTLKMGHDWQIDSNELVIQYDWWLGNKKNYIKVMADSSPIPIIPESESEFILEHYWGYTKAGKSKTTEYEVKHPTWKIYNVNSYEVNIDFAKVYGPEFAHHSNSEPASVMLAEGSEISVENKRNI